MDRPLTTIAYSEAGRAGQIRLDRPDRRNGITNTMIRELWELLGDLAVRPDLSVVTLTGNGDWFCPGADFGHFASGAETVTPRREWFQLSTLLYEMPQVTVAAINGPCAGAGMAWACACDLRIASSAAVFNTAFLDVSVPGDMGLPWTLTRIVGGATARELLLLPRKLDADEALGLGLVSRVVPAERLATEVAGLVARLAGADPAALAAMKDHVVRSERLGLGDFVALETERHLRISRAGAARSAFRSKAGS